MFSYDEKMYLTNGHFLRKMPGGLLTARQGNMAYSLMENWVLPKVCPSNRRSSV